MVVGYPASGVKPLEQVAGCSTMLRTVVDLNTPSENVLPYCSWMSISNSRDGGDSVASIWDET